MCACGGGQAVDPATSAQLGQPAQSGQTLTTTDQKISQGASTDSSAQQAVRNSRG
jgi:hypothetical protein